MSSRKFILGLSASCLAFSSSQVFAQNEAAAQGKDAQSGGLEEIIVTAQKRAENLQEVPISIAAVTATTLTQSGVTNSDSLTQLVPGLQIGRQIGAITPYLRGVGTQQTAAGDESSIASYVDGVYRVSLYSSIQSYNNIERVEVLKGPQGTLFGRNATGGLLHIITKDPSHTKSLKVSQSYGSYETMQAGFYGTTGLSEQLAADLSVTYADQGKGYGLNRFTGHDINKSREFAVRSKMLWEPGDDTRVMLSGDYSNNRSSSTITRQIAAGQLGFDGAIIFGGCRAGGGSVATCAPLAVAGATKNTGNYYDINSDTDSFYTAKSYGGAIQIDQKFGGANLVSISSYRKAKALQVLDQDATVLPIIYAPLQTAVKDFQQELRLESSGDGPFKWIVGAYYLNSTSKYNNFNLSGIAVTQLAPGAIALRAKPIQKTTSLAGFAQIEFQITDRTTLTAGGRYTRDKREFTSSNEIVLGAPTGPFFSSLADFQNATYVQVPVNSTGVLVARSSATFSQPSWRISLDHKVSDDLLLYASYNRGFKSGVYNLANSASPGPVRPEKLDAYEIGFKSEFADNVVRLNGSVFYYDYRDLQLAAIRLGATALLNAASARNKGAELDLEVAPSSNVSLHAGVSYLDAKYTDFPTAPVFTPTGIGGNAQSVASAKGKRLSRSPEFTFSVGGNVNFETGVGRVDVYGNLYHNGGYFWDPQNAVKQAAYTIVNAGGSLSISEHVKLIVSGDNLFDAKYSNYSDDGQFGSSISAASPRLFRAGVEFNF